MIEINYYKKLGIFHEHFVGKFTINDLVQYYIKIGANTELPRELRVIVDYTRAKFTFDIDDLDKLADTVKENIANYKYVKAAILHSKPHEQAISMMFEKLVKNIPNFYTEIFTTKEAAIDWLQLYDIDPIKKKELTLTRKVVR